MLEKLPSTLVREVLDGLTAVEVVSVGLVCRSLHEEAHVCDLWEQRCGRLWEGKVVQVIRESFRRKKNAEAFFGSIVDAKRAELDLEGEDFEYFTQLCFHMSLKRDVSLPLMGSKLKDADGKFTPMFRRFAATRSCPRYATEEDKARNPDATCPVKDPIEEFEETYGILIAGEPIRWARPNRREVVISGLPGMKISRREDNWAWRIENETIVYESCSKETRSGPPPCS